MANYTKQEQRKREMARFTAAQRVPADTSPKCRCGAKAAFAAHDRSRVTYYCDDHVEDAEFQPAPIARR